MAITSLVFGQKKFNTTIILDKKIDAKNVHCSYNNGKSIIFITDTFVNNTIYLEGVFYSKYAALSVTYSQDGSFGHRPDFFIDEKPSKLAFDLRQKNGTETFVFTTAINATLINDTTKNNIVKAIYENRKREGKKLGALWEKHDAEHIFGNDSLRKLNDSLMTVLTKKELNILEKYADYYYTFWYFKNQVFDNAMFFLNNDISFISYLINWMHNTFPQKFIQTIEGDVIDEMYQKLINPVKVNSLAPNFSTTDINGLLIKSEDYKNKKYILLDFWATWCGPCMKAVSFLKSIREDIPQNKLEIIGVSFDTDSLKFAKAIQDNKMDWLHIYDINNDMGRLYNVKPIPDVILIDRSGIIVYRGTGGEESEDLKKLLKKIQMESSIPIAPLKSQTKK